MSAASPPLEHRFARPFGGAGDRLATWAGAKLGVKPVAVDLAPHPLLDATGEPRAVRSAVVVGGGLAGATAALRLAEAGLPVTLLEQSDYLLPLVCGKRGPFHRNGAGRNHPNTDAIAVRNPKIRGALDSVPDGVTKIQ